MEDLVKMTGINVLVPGLDSISNGSWRAAARAHGGTTEQQQNAITLQALLINEM